MNKNCSYNRLFSCLIFSKSKYISTWEGVAANLYCNVCGIEMQKMQVLVGKTV